MSDGAGKSSGRIQEASSLLHTSALSRQHIKIIDPNTSGQKALQGEEFSSSLTLLTASSNKGYSADYSSEPPCQITFYMFLS